MYQAKWHMFGNFSVWQNKPRFKQEIPNAGRLEDAYLPNRAEECSVSTMDDLVENTDAMWLVGLR